MRRTRTTGRISDERMYQAALRKYAEHMGLVVVDRVAFDRTKQALMERIRFYAAMTCS